MVCFTIEHLIYPKLSSCVEGFQHPRHPVPSVGLGSRQGTRSVFLYRSFQETGIIIVREIVRLAKKNVGIWYFDQKLQNFGNILVYCQYLAYHCMVKISRFQKKYRKRLIFTLSRSFSEDVIIHLHWENSIK